MTKFKVNCIIIIIAIIGICVSIITGCENQSNTDYIQQPIPTQNETYTWIMTDDGFCHYRWENDGSCVIMFNKQTYNLSRSISSGLNGPISWNWESDGDLDIAVGTKQYDLDSPFDIENDGYETIVGGALIGASGSALFHKKQKTNKDIKLKQQKNGLKQKQSANLIKKSSFFNKTTTTSNKYTTSNTKRK